MICYFYFKIYIFKRSQFSFLIQQVSTDILHKRQSSLGSAMIFKNVLKGSSETKNSDNCSFKEILAHVYKNVHQSLFVTARNENKSMG